VALDFLNRRSRGEEEKGSKHNSVGSVTVRQGGAGETGKKKGKWSGWSSTLGYREEGKERPTFYCVTNKELRGKKKKGKKRLILGPSEKKGKRRGRIPYSPPIKRGPGGGTDHR